MLKLNCYFRISAEEQEVAMLYLRLEGLVSLFCDGESLASPDLVCLVAALPVFLPATLISSSLLHEFPM